MKTPTLLLTTLLATAIGATSLSAQDTTSVPAPAAAAAPQRKAIDHASHGGDYRYGFVDANENWIIAPRYDEAAWHGIEGFAIVTTYSPAQKGVIDRYGDFVIPMDDYAHLRYDKASDTFIVSRRTEAGRLTGVMDRAGKVVIPLQHTKVEYLADDRCYRVTTTSGVRTYVDKSGQTVSAPAGEY